MIKNRKLGHIGLAVDNPEADVQWYKDNMGFEEIATFKLADNTAHFLKNGDVIYEIYRGDNIPAQARGLVDHVCYDSEDIEADWEYCKEQGYRFISTEIEYIPEFWSNGYKYFILETPTGDKIEIGQIL